MESRCELPRHPQCQRSPAATQFQHPLAVGQLRALRGQGKRQGFRVGKVVDAFRPPGAAVLAMRSQHVREEVRRHFVVLFVCQLGQRRHFGGSHRAHELLSGEAGAFGVCSRDFHEPLRAHATDARPDQRVGNQAAFHQVDGSASQRGVVMYSLRVRHDVHPAAGIAWGEYGTGIARNQRPGVICYKPIQTL
jgi:hypothetical protein